MSSWVSSFVDLFYPRVEVPGEVFELKEPFCRICEEPYPKEAVLGIICWNCRGRTWALDVIRAGYESKSGVREVIHGFKYEQKFHYLPLLVEWLGDGYKRFYQDQTWDGVVPVPLYPLRQRERGFNQSKELAKGLCKEMGLPLRDILVKKRKALIQAKLREKRENS